MKSVISLVFLVAFFCVVQSNAANLRDNKYANDGEDPLLTGGWFKDASDKWVKLDLTDVGSNTETLEETKLKLADQVVFFLNTRLNPLTGQQLWVDNDAALQASRFDPRKPTRIITHGWTQTETSYSITVIRDAYLRQGDYNIILVGWGAIAENTYAYAQTRVKLVGGWIARFVDYLETKGLNLSTTVIIGHSLGAHVAGLAGHQTQRKVGYVVGLDPAGPSFYTASSGSRVSKGDADFVQNIHTNGGVLGIGIATGDIDFYPNGGSSQPGCYDLLGYCAHTRAFTYFAESINSNVGFLGTQCNSYSAYTWQRCRGNPVALMGGSSLETSLTGSFYLDTNRRSPFAQG